MSFENMGKVELRAACKAAGVAYGKLNNDGMRAALTAKQAEQGIGPVGSDNRPAPIDPVLRKQVETYMEKTKDAPFVSKSKYAGRNIGEAVQDEKVKIGTLNVQTGVVTPVVETPVVDVTPRETVTGKVVKPKSLKIEKVRDNQNKVTRPSAGSICRQIWDQLDTKRAADKAVPTFENLRDLMKQYGWSKNTAMTQYQRWKQFNGVMPRTSEVVDEAAETGDDTGIES